HPRAPRFLGFLSFIEAIFFPVMPEVMLAPMTLARPLHWFRYASISLVGSLLGALVGYALGYFAYEAIRPLLASLGWIGPIDEQVTYLRGVAAESPWKAFWILVLAGFAPLPAKFFSWVAGFGRLRADPAQVLHLGLRHRRRAAGTVHGEHVHRPRQAGVPAGRGDPAGRAARGGGAAALDRAAGLDRGVAAGGAGGLPGVEGAR